MLKAKFSGSITSSLQDVITSERMPNINDKNQVTNLFIYYSVKDMFLYFYNFILENISGQ